MNNKENTFFDSTIPGDVTVSGIKPVSMGSIALLQLVNNPIGDIILNGGEIPVNDIMTILQFVYIHTHELKETARLCINYKNEPEPFNMAVLEYGMELSTDKLIDIFKDITRDRDNIRNSKTEIIPTNKNSKSKNVPCQQ